MAQHYSPRIVTDGLVLCLDAASRKSYPGSGTVWNDLSGYGNHGVLTGGPIFTTSNLGTFSYDGTNDTTIVQESESLKPASVITLSAWIRFQSFSSNFIGIIDKYNGISSGYLLDIPSSTNKKPRFTLCTTSNSNNQIVGNTTIQENSWYMITGVYNGSNIFIYVNGNLDGSTGASGTITYFVTETIKIGSDGVSTLYTPCSYAASHIYNRALTQAEVSQNFNATRGRFGI